MYNLLKNIRHRINVDGVGVYTLLISSGCTLNCRYCLNRKALELKGDDISVEDLYNKDFSKLNIEY